MARDTLQRSFSRYPDLWFGGKVVWGRIVQANNALFSTGDGDSPGEVVYDPTGRLDHDALADPARKLYALKGTTPTDKALRNFADHLTDERTRACGMPVPESIARFPLLLSTVLFHRKHLPGGKIILPYFPILINDNLPGVVMVLPGRWWPDEMLDRLRSGADTSNPGTTANAYVATTKPRPCSNCKEPMRKLGLAAHYQRAVEIDVCEPCSLIWFDDTESARLAGPGLADLIRIIHGAMQRPRPLQPLPLALPCPICTTALKRVSNVSRYGRTAQLECPEKHGAFQSFALFLAEKGYFRPFGWADIKKALESGKRLSCFNCGATLESRPQDACLYCKSPVGLIDPARLAAAIDVERAAQPLQLTPKVKQTACPCCGGAIDLSAEMVCPHCKAIVRPIETKDALAASEAVASQVRDNYMQQAAAVSRRKLDAAGEFDAPAFSMPRGEGVRRGAIILIALVTLGIVFSKIALRKVDLTERNPDGRPIGMSPIVWEGMENARRETEMSKTPHAPSGVVPPQLEVIQLQRHRISVVNRSAQRLKVAVNMNYEYGGGRCKMLNVDGANPVAGKVTFTRADESHVFAPDSACDPQILNNGKYEYAVWSIDADRYVFKSDSAF